MVTVVVTDRVTDTERMIYVLYGIDIASSKSVWRGMEYYKQNKVLSYTVNKDINNSNKHFRFFMVKNWN